MVGPHQRLMLRHLLNHVDFLARQIGLLDREVAKRTRPFEAAIEMLDAIYGIGRRTAEDVLAENRRRHEPLAQPPPNRLLGQDLST